MWSVIARVIAYVSEAGDHSGGHRQGVYINEAGCVISFPDRFGRRLRGVVSVTQDATPEKAWFLYFVKCKK